MQLTLSRLGLRFENRDEERRFVEQYVSGNIGWTQAAMLLGAATYVSYTVWDWILYPQIAPTTFGIRGGVALFILLPLTFLLSTSLKRRAETIYLIYCVVPGCVLAAIYLIIPSGFLHAAAGMIVVILFVSTLLPLRLGSFVIFCAMTWTALFVSELFAPELPPGLQFLNHFEIGTAYALSLWAVGAREFQARKQFRTAEALKLEKERSEANVAMLRETQTHLVQAEKLASLGQIVAGVAHEVSTPLGVALTTSTALESDIRSMAQMIATGQVRRSDLTRSIDRLQQGIVSAKRGRPPVSG